MTSRREVLNSDLLDRIADDFAGDPDVESGTMFRNPGFRVGGKVFAFLGSHGQLIVKLPSDRATEFVDRGVAERVVMGKRTMREWIALPAHEDRAATLALWRTAAQVAYRYVDALRRSS